MDENTSVDVIDAQPEHLPLIAELTLRAYEPVLPNLYSGGYDADLTDMTARAESAMLLVALFGGFVVGGVTYIADETSPLYEFDEAGASFRHLAVDPSAQGLGAGRALVAECVRRAEQRGAPQMLIHSSEAMAAAIGVYEQFGFERDPSLDERWGNVHGIGLRLIIRR